MRRMNSTRTARARLPRVIPGLLFCLATAGSLFAQTTSVNLQAVSTTRNILGQTITFWVFDDLDVPADTTDYDLDPDHGYLLKRRIPGPEITVGPGESLEITLTNNLPEPTSVYIPGQKPPVVQEEDGVGGWVDLATQGVTRMDPENDDNRIRSLTQETPAGETRRYVWTDLRPGTYLYRSGTHMTVQVQMGLYGALRKDATTTEVYPGKTADTQATLVYSEIDAGLHAAVADASYGTPAFPTTIDYVPTYFLINGELNNTLEGDGRPAALVDAAQGSTLLLRLINAGLKTRVPTLLGGHFDVIAEDGIPYEYPKEQYSAILPAGKTKDLLLEIAVDAEVDRKIPLFGRRLYRTLGSAAGGVNGGQIAYIKTVAPPTP